LKIDEITEDELASVVVGKVPVFVAKNVRLAEPHCFVNTHFTNINNYNIASDFSAMNSCQKSSFLRYD
jgi:hypothetical protein